jgi:uncharacterized protein YydD (DUF2326 family)
MIHRLTSDLPAFKSLNFHPGLNLLLADRSPGATERQTRNGAGKTSLVELLHFLLGSSAGPKTLFRNPALADVTFSVELDLGPERCRASRRGSQQGQVWVEPALPGVEHPQGAQARPTRLSLEEWKERLGRAWFQHSSATGGPSPRSLFSYFARRQESDGFSAFERHSSKQQLGDQQVSLTYLLGLDWAVPQALHRVRERERALRELKKAVGEGPLRDLIGTVADLRTSLTLTQARARSMKDELAHFRVHAEHQTLEVEAAALTRVIADLSDENTLDRELLACLEDASTSERAPQHLDLSRVYEQAGVLLPGAILRRFEDVYRFHASVVQNRSSYLAQERSDTEARIAKRGEKMASLDARRAQVMEILQSHGALDQFTHLQSELSRVEGEAEQLRQRFLAAEQLESQKIELQRERGDIALRLQRDHHDRSEVLTEAILCFEGLSRALYEDAGSLTLQHGANGPEFKVRIQGERSKGISNMQIFCFDLMLLELNTRRGRGPGFLVHDSHLFDGVDERQVARALQVGAQKAEELGVQYIVTLNSDALPRSLPPGFSVERHLLPVRLTDATETGGLFGIRFR